MFRKLYPTAANYVQEHLCELLLNKKYNAHNALDDVLCLPKLYFCKSAHKDNSVGFSFTVTWGIEHWRYKEQTNTNLSTFDDIVKGKVISKQSASKIAASGLRYNHVPVVDVYQRQGLHGINELFKDKCDGIPHVRCSLAVIQSLANHLKTLND